MTVGEVEVTIRINVSRCDLCGGCVSVCPADCMTLRDLRLEIDYSECIMCEFCLAACPVGALTSAADDGPQPWLED